MRKIDIVQISMKIHAQRTLKHTHIHTLLVCSQCNAFNWILSPFSVAICNVALYSMEFAPTLTDWVLMFSTSTFWRFSFRFGFAFSTLFVFIFCEMPKLFRMISDIVIWLCELIPCFRLIRISSFLFSIFTFSSTTCVCVRFGIFWLFDMISALPLLLFPWKYRLPFWLVIKFASNQETWNQFAKICHFQFDCTCTVQEHHQVHCCTLHLSWDPRVIFTPIDCQFDLDWKYFMANHWHTHTYTMQYEFHSQ